MGSTTQSARFGKGSTPPALRATFCFAPNRHRLGRVLPLRRFEPPPLLGEDFWLNIMSNIYKKTPLEGRRGLEVASERFITESVTAADIRNGRELRHSSEGYEKD